MGNLFVFRAHTEETVETYAAGDLAVGVIQMVVLKLRTRPKHNRGQYSPTSILHNLTCYQQCWKADFPGKKNSPIRKIQSPTQLGLQLFLIFPSLPSLLPSPLPQFTSPLLSLPFPYPISPFPHFPSPSPQYCVTVTPPSSLFPNITSERWL